MTANGTFERTLESWLEAEAPATAPAGLHTSAIERAGHERQRPGWLVAVRGDAYGASAGAIGRPAVGVALVVLALALALVVAAVAGAFRPHQGPVLKAGAFIRPFEYVLPIAGTMRTTSERAHLYGFTEGSDEMQPLGPDGKPIQGVRGITVALTDGAVTHPCPLEDAGPSRVPVGAAPLAFLDDLRKIAGIGLGAPATTTLDGRPAVTVIVDPSTSRCDYGDFHPLPGGIGGGFVALTVPSRLTLVEVDGETVVVQVWAGTEEALAAWLPIASEFVDSIHFVQDQ